MKYTIPLLALASVGAAVDAFTTCHRNNCLRAIIASAFPTRDGAGDCSSYFRTTVTPDTITHTCTKHQTTTATADATTTVTVGPPMLPVRMRRRDVVDSPTAIPEYASACDTPFKYSSACSCIGVTASTITVAAPLTTITVSPTDVTVTNTQTQTLTATTLQFRFVDNLSTYSLAFLASKTYSGSAFAVPTTVVGSSVQATIMPDGSVSAGDGKILVGKQSSVVAEAKYLLWVSPSDVSNPIYFPVTCSINPDTTVHCQVPDGDGYDTVFGAYTGSDYKDSLRLFAAASNIPTSSYLGPLHLVAI